MPYNTLSSTKRGEMTKLSQGAQAVLNAFENASDGEYVEGVWVVNERTMLAAALRAVAEHCVPDDSEGHWVYIPHVLAIADELHSLVNTNTESSDCVWDQNYLR